MVGIRELQAYRRRQYAGREDDLVAAIAKPWEEQIVSNGKALGRAVSNPCAVGSVQDESVRILSEEVGRVCLWRLWPWLGRSR